MNKIYKIIVLALCLSLSGLPAFAVVKKSAKAKTKKTVSGKDATKTKEEPVDPKDQKIQFNFVDVELSTLAKFISEITGKNFIYDDRLKGKVTIVTPLNISVADSYDLFSSVLEIKGFTVVPAGVNAFKIIPSSEARQKGIRISTERSMVNESYIAQLIPLKYISVDEALKFLQPLISKDGHIATFGPSNLILIVDSGLNIEKIVTIISTIDKPQAREQADIIYLKYANADLVTKIINENVNRAKPGGPPQITPSTNEPAKAVSDPRLNAVILFGEPESKEYMRKLIALIDVPSPEAQGRINIYTLEHADATEMAEVLNMTIKGAPSKAGPSGQPGQPGQAAPVTLFESGGMISITPEKSTNSLIIVASPADFLNLVQIIKQLDKRRKQVFVEALIAEVSMDKLQDLGTKWRNVATRNGKPVAVMGVGQVDTTTLSSIITGLEGLTVGGLGNYYQLPASFITPGASGSFTAPGLAAIFNINEFKGAVNVLSTPRILTSDNKEAEIIVGEDVPFVGQRVSNAGASTTAVNPYNSVASSVERHTIGIKLKLTPQITEGDYVKLDLYQEISSLKQSSENVLINLGPSTTIRSTKTSVIVKNKQTVVIGGLLQEKEEENVFKVPLLGDIPILGWLFKYSNKTKAKTNLLIFITPHIIKDQVDIDEITEKTRKDHAKVRGQFKSGELIVKFKETVPEEDTVAIITKSGFKVIRYMENMKLYHIELGREIGVEDAIDKFKQIPEVEYAEPNYTIEFK